MSPQRGRSGSSLGYLASIFDLCCLVTLTLGVFLSPDFALASPSPTTSAAIATSAQQLIDGRTTDAITTLELVADQGQRGPELSFNRGLAYLQRVGTASEQPGDLGQAAAAFAETLSQRPDDAEAQRGFEECQLAVARRNSKGKAGQGAQVSSPLGLLERALLSLNPAILFWLAAASSGLLCLGLLIRLRQSELLRLSATVAAGIGLLVLVPSAFAFHARNLFFSDAVGAVIVVQEAHLVDEAGKKLPGRSALAESTLVYLRRSDRGLARLVGVSNEYLSLGQVRVVSRETL